MSRLITGYSNGLSERTRYLKTNNFKLKRSIQTRGVDGCSKIELTYLQLNRVINHKYFRFKLCLEYLNKYSSNLVNLFPFEPPPVSAKPPNNSSLFHIFDVTLPITFCVTHCSCRWNSWLCFVHQWLMKNQSRNFISPSICDRHYALSVGETLRKHDHVTFVVTWSESHCVATDFPKYIVMFHY